MFNETIDYTICSYDPEHYNRIDVNLPSPQTRNAKMIITSLTTKCSIVVLNNDDFIQITVIRKEKAEALRAKAADERSKGPEGQSPEQPEIENSSEMSQSQNILDKQKHVELKDVKKLTS